MSLESPGPVCLHERDRIETFLRRNSFLHLYELGDLDSFFWPYTIWYGSEVEGRLEALFLVYIGTASPVLLALDEAPLDRLRGLLSAAIPFLPARFYAHLSGDLGAVFDGRYRLNSHGRHHKMALQEPERLGDVDTSAVVPLSVDDLPALQKLYVLSYPDNAFDPRMLKTGHTYGIWRDGEIVSVAGVHVCSVRYRVAALGNIATHPDYRGQGLARAVTARACRELLKCVDHVGLNVHADNGPAIACYRRLGFKVIAEYFEASLVHV